MSDPATRTLEAKCFCGAFHINVDVPVSSLPLPIHLCHCSLCRYRSGTPCVFHTPIREASKKIRYVAPSSPSNITAYAAPEGRSDWLFCSTCGCHIASKEHSGDEWVLSTSVLSDNGPDVVQIRKHIFSKSSKDGGIASMLSHIGGREMIDWNPPEGDRRAPLVESEAEFDASGNQVLRAKCHCGGVSFAVSKPTTADTEDEVYRDFVSPLDKTKWLACFDVCSDCRLVNGTHVVGWMFLPLSSIEPPIKPDLQIGTAKTFATSEGVLRSFCGTCGATVFYTCKDRRHSDGRQVVDLATGILRAPEGPMAEEWLTWRTRVAWLPSGKQYDGEFAQALEEGMKEWTVKRYGQELDLEIG